MRTHKEVNPGSIAGIFLLSLFIVASLIVSTSVRSQDEQQTMPGPTVRGKVERKAKSSKYPAPNVRLTLAVRSTKVRSAPVYTDDDGMYYFRNVTPGQYILEIWGSEKNPIQRFYIEVSDSKNGYVDISPVTLP
ncbi:MAG TPA: carboxypeptidase-like regulatory domain-containing protein [Pyrinomonadaceae bacterium]